MNDLDLLHNLHHTQGSYKRLYHKLVEEDEKLSKKDVFGYGRMLHTLIRLGDMEQKQLAETLDIRPQSLTTALNKLEKNGYIQRERDTKDHRIQIVHLTEEGRQIGEALHVIRCKAAKEFFSCLNSQEKEELMKLLNKIEEANND